MPEGFLKRLFSKVDCGICGQKYEPANIKVLDHEEGLWFLSVFCSSCGTQGLIAAVVQEGNIAEVATDYVGQDAPPEGEIVCVDDVLDMHNVLKEFNGDFSKLFGEQE